MAKTEPSMSVIVPSRGRTGALGRLLACLSQQELDRCEGFEVVVALDGSSELPPLCLQSEYPFELEVIRLDQVGICGAKNAAVARSRGGVLLFINDDIEPAPHFIEEHTIAQEAGHPIVLGDSPWPRYQDQTIFDDLMAHSKMVFFYHHLRGGRHYDFRHAWNLNLSVRRECVEGLDGPYVELLRPVYYDDVEMAFRLMGREPRVYFHPAAKAVHNHRYTPVSYFLREALLGVMAIELNQVNPDCFKGIFSGPFDRLVAHAREGMVLDVPDRQRVLARWVDLVAEPCPGEANQELIDALYLAHLPLKRRAFRCGLIAALNQSETPWRERLALASSSLAADPVFQAIIGPSDTQAEPAQPSASPLPCPQSA